MSNAIETDSDTKPNSGPSSNGTEPASIWEGVFGARSVLDAWRQYSKTVFERMTPLVRESTQTWLTLGEKSCKLNVELLKAAVAATQPGSFAEAAARTGEIWKETVEVVRETIEAVAHTNTQAVELWVDPAGPSVAPQESEEAVPHGPYAFPETHTPTPHEAIRKLAYEIWERKGRRHGNDWEDWFEAEIILSRACRLAA